jgi:anti-anti-sigma factor
MYLTTTALSTADTVLVHVPHDQLTHLNALIFDRALDAVLGQSKNTILDLEKVAFMDSMVMKKLLKSQQRINKRNGHLVFIRLSPTVNALFELIGLSDILTVREDVDSALEFLESQSLASSSPIASASD